LVSVKDLTMKHKWVAAVGLVGLLVFAGMWLSRENAKDEVRKTEAEQARQVTEGVGSLADLFRRDLETLKSQAEIAQALPDGAETQLGHGIVLWAELGFDGRTIGAPRRVVEGKGITHAEVESYYLPAAIQFLAASGRTEGLKRGGMALLRMKKTSEGIEEWLGLAFASRGRVLLTLIDPVQAFSGVASWGEVSASAGLRSYLATRDGFVFIHSRMSYTNTEFRDSPVFQQVEASHVTERPLVVRGRAIDGLSVALAVVSAPELPLDLVVEKELPAEPVAETSGLSWAWTLFLAAVAWTIFSRRKGRSRPGPSLTQPVANPTAFTENAGLVIEESPLAVTEGSPLRSPESSGLPFAIEAELAERALEAKMFGAPDPMEELRAAEAARAIAEVEAAQTRARSEEERAILDRFEVEVAKHQDPKKVAYAVTTLAQRLYRGPALFFGYQPMVKKAFFTTAVGFSESVSARFSLTFDITSECMTKILEADAKGETKSLTDYLPLSSMLQIAFRERRFVAWPVTGETKFDWSGKSHARLLGVLVILLPAENEKRGVSSTDRQLELTSMLKAAGRSYEKALPRL
jgi:hypothetical protein